MGIVEKGRHDGLMNITDAVYASFVALHMSMSILEREILPQVMRKTQFN